MSLEIGLIVAAIVILIAASAFFNTQARRDSPLPHRARITRSSRRATPRRPSSISPFLTGEDDRRRFARQHAGGRARGLAGVRSAIRLIGDVGIVYATGIVTI